MNDELREGSRTGYRLKRKKTNLILNSLIAIVILLIMVVSAFIFLGDDEKEVSPKEKQNGLSSSEKTSANNENDDSEQVTNEETKLEVEAEEETEADEEIELETETENVETSGGSDANVEKTIENPSWKSVGTTQTGEHVAVYDENSSDWQEMLKAISYGAGIDEGNMTVWRLENNNGNPNASIGTISTKDTKEAYRVYIEWVNGEGWKPTKVEKLLENDKD